jgi:hypothetical protein
MDSSDFSPIANVRDLRWSLPEIIVGDGSDARTCRFLFKSNIRHCHPSQGFIQFMNGRTFYPYSGCLADGTPAYLFYPDGIGEIYRRRQAEYRIEEWFATAPIDDARAIGELLLEAAGSHSDLIWIESGIVWEQVESHILNVGLPHLEQLVDLIAPRNAAGQQAPPLAMAS